MDTQKMCTDILILYSSLKSDEDISSGGSSLEEDSRRRDCGKMGSFYLEDKVEEIVSEDDPNMFTIYQNKTLVLWKKRLRNSLHFIFIVKYDHWALLIWDKSHETFYYFNSIASHVPEFFDRENILERIGIKTPYKVVPPEFDVEQINDVDCGFIVFHVFEQMYKKYKENQNIDVGAAFQDVCKEISETMPALSKSFDGRREEMRLERHRRRRKK